jgi:predicted nucleic acid-binding Zn ribbon protein
MRKTNTQPLKEAIDAFLKEYKVDKKFLALKLLAEWEKLLGPVIAKHTHNIFVKDKTLHVKVDSSVIREELHYAKEKLIKSLNEAAGAEVIDNIVFK